MRSGDRALGFTLVEMLMVVLIVSLLITMAIPVYQKSLIRTREDVLRGNLALIRAQIDEYTFDKQKGLQSLQDLVTDGYLRAVPVDPMTGTNQSWKIDMDDALRFPAQTDPGIFDVHSASSKKALDGTLYSDW